MDARGFDLRHTFVHLHDGAEAAPIPVADDFWQTIASRTELHDGRLVTVSSSSADWPFWERHPAGDEIVYALSGSFEFVLDEGAHQRRVALSPQTACIVPQGTWHRAIVREAGDLLFITRGAGTEHRPLADGPSG
jgi:mannose-6-phosphate isomerase-like protein (cupin superfamily)